MVTLLGVGKLVEVQAQEENFGKMGLNMQLLQIYH